MGSNQYGVVKTVIAPAVVVEAADEVPVVEVPVVAEARVPRASKKENLGKSEEV
jgi:hypothetical protein